MNNEACQKTSEALNISYCYNAIASYNLKRLRWKSSSRPRNKYGINPPQTLAGKPAINTGGQAPACPEFLYGAGVQGFHKCL